MATRKEFNLYVIARKSFDLVIEEFTVSLSWVLSILISGVTLVAVSSETLRFALDLIVNGTSLSISKVNFIENPDFTLSNNSPRIITVVSSLVGVPLLLFSAGISVSTTMSFFERVSISMGDFTFSSVFVPILALFSPLSLWDIETLGTLDVEILQDLDYTT